MAGSAVHRRAKRPTRDRKNMRLDQDLLDSAKLALGTESETEAVTRALRRVVNNRLVANGLRALGGSHLVNARRVDDAMKAR